MYSTNLVIADIHQANVILNVTLFSLKSRWKDGHFRYISNSFYIYMINK